MVRSGSSSMAPKRKHSPPTNVPKFTSTMFRGRPVVGTTNDATAETPKAAEPTKFRAVIHQGTLRNRQQAKERHTSNHASPLATRKHAEPSASGAQTRRLS